MPVPAEVGFQVRDDDHVKGARWNDRLTSGTHVGLAGGVWLDDADGHPEEIAHHTTATVAARASTTITMSAVRTRNGRNGFKPINQGYRPVDPKRRGETV